MGCPGGSLGVPNVLPGSPARLEDAGGLRWLKPTLPPGPNEAPAHLLPGFLPPKPLLPRFPPPGALPVRCLGPGPPPPLGATPPPSDWAPPSPPGTHSPGNEQPRARRPFLQNEWNPESGPGAVDAGRGPWGHHRTGRSCSAGGAGLPMSPSTAGNRFAQQDLQVPIWGPAAPSPLQSPHLP